METRTQFVCWKPCPHVIDMILYRRRTVYKLYTCIKFEVHCVDVHALNVFGLDINPS